MKLIEILFPVFSIVLGGYFYGRLHRPTLQGLNQLMLWVFVPALVFDVMSNKSFQLFEYRWLALAGLITVLGSGLFAWALAKPFGYPVRSFVPTMTFNNCGNLGLPLALFAFGETGLEGFVVLFLISNVLHFTLGTWIFGGIVSWKGLLLNPVNIATFSGLVINFTQFELPDFVLEPISMLGQIVIPFMLFTLGLRMTEVNRAHLQRGFAGGIIRPIVGLAAALVAIWLVPLGDFQLGLLILFAALPPAVLNFLFAEQYKQDSILVASLVLVGNALSVVTIGAVLWWLI